METKENKNIKYKNSKKIKRQVSIITVFLCIFLVTTMVTIVSKNIKNTNALEEKTQQDQIFGRYIEIYPSKFPSSSIKGKSHSYDSITKKVGEKASFQSTSTTNHLCSRCNKIVIEYIPDQYYGIVPKMSNDGI